jgi:Fic family protein
MKTIESFLKKPPAIPSSCAWYLGAIAEAKGRQDLFTRQSPQRLKALREHALIQSAVSSNRIEGITIDQTRVATVVLGKPLLRDRNEEEIGGYREALKLIHEKNQKLDISRETILHLHKLTRGDIWDAGKFKEKDGDIIEKHPDGSVRIRFKTVSAKQTPGSMSRLIALWNEPSGYEKIPYPILLAAFNLDFLCIHPFRDGNGRVSRLLLLLQAYHGGLEVGRYISLERLIEDNKERYYETLAESSHGWHEGKHDPWPYIQFVLYIVKSAYKEFEERLGAIKSPRGEKRSLVVEAIKKAAGPFTVRELQHTFPGISIDMIRLVLKQMRKSGDIECLGRGQSAQWRKVRK